MVSVVSRYGLGVPAAMSSLANPAAISSATASSRTRYSAGVVRTVMRSKRTMYRAAPWFTSANGTVWIWPLSAIEHSQRPAGGSRRTARKADGSALFCMWIAGPRSLAAGWLSGRCHPSSRQSTDQRRRVSGGRPVIVHAQPGQSQGEERISAWSWSVKVSVITSSTLQARASSPVIGIEHQ